MMERAPTINLSLSARNCSGLSKVRPERQGENVRGGDDE